ncbi:MAG: hypothetical protein A3F68_09070 [Acidobacteria bacterium RIFCSPLOWO2_12_FULL_54_10]|nr:MAG: hypothetical protein A3F68_09070 [Acidobacteria bacterium RIFCSPLOWO2_12_FULL_54_10]
MFLFRHFPAVNFTASALGTSPIGSNVFPGRPSAVRSSAVLLGTVIVDHGLFPILIWYGTATINEAGKFRME